MITLTDIAQGEELISLIARCRYDFKLFCDRIIQVNPLGQPLDIQPFHEKWANLFKSNKRTCILAPRTSGKTLVLGVLFPLWIAFYEEGKHFLIISSNLNNSKDIVRNIRSYINTNELLGTLCSKGEREGSWTKTQIVTSTNCMIQCRAFSGNVRGSHTSYLLVDESGTFTDIDIYRRVIVPVVNAANGNICAIGTKEHSMDLLGDLEKNSEYVYESYSAIKENGKPLWESRFPLAMLEKRKREMGESAFASEFLGEAREETLKIFPPSKIVNAYDDKLEFSLTADKERECYLGIDLARSPTGDYSVYSVIEKVKDKFILIYQRRTRGANYKSQLAEVLDIVNDFNVKGGLVDSSQWGDSFTDELQSQGAPLYGQGFDARARGLLISNLIRLFDEGRIVIPRNKDSGYTTEMVDVLAKELSHMILDNTKTGLKTYRSTTSHDDTVIAMTLACKAADQDSRVITHIESF